MRQREKHLPTTEDLIGVLRNQKRAVLATASAVMLLTLAVTYFGPKKYTSEAKLFVRLGRETMALDPKTHRLYVPSMRAGQFTILVLERAANSGS